MFTYQQLLQHLHAGKEQLNAFKQFRRELTRTEFNLQLITEEGADLIYKDTLKSLISWLDWFLTETGYEEGVLIHNVNYINRRIQSYPAIELDIERRRIELHKRAQNNKTVRSSKSDDSTGNH